MPFTGDLAERELIRELIARYCDAVCQRDETAWGATWADDGEWNLPELGIEGIRGRAAIVAAWRNGMALFPFVQMMAQAGSIEIQGERAMVRCYTDELAVMQDGTVKRPRGQYDDVCVKRDGEWLFQSRTFKVLHGG